MAYIKEDTRYLLMALLVQSQTVLEEVGQGIFVGLARREFRHSMLRQGAFYELGDVFFGESNGIQAIGNTQVMHEGEESVSESTTSVGCAG